eukprot:CAMPEP_0119431642 /NCGR_PEP_ID=MMETSP1335-20130426/46304_1 /TAXON_ID=259385 /ORGANISM="Chrysoculter rhomboideus, Strain RCC1486" /LENGTH=153 /DNA_ID=CAMNT_0007457449 /DNA_START=120 /DNA_END=578 /DNA_ORIENTATION=+
MTMRTSPHPHASAPAVTVSDATLGLGGSCRTRARRATEAAQREADGDDGGRGHHENQTELCERQRDRVHQRAAGELIARLGQLEVAVRSERAHAACEGAEAREPVCTRRATRRIELADRGDQRRPEPLKLEHQLHHLSLCERVGQGGARVVCC